MQRVQYVAMYADMMCVVCKTYDSQSANHGENSATHASGSVHAMPYSMLTPKHPKQMFNILLFIIINY